MEPNINLVINNLLFIIAVVFAFGVSLFTYLNGRRNESNITFSLLILSAIVFMISHAIGINVSNPDISHNILMWNMCMFIAGAFQVHSILALIGKSQEKRWLIIFMYVSAISFIILFIISPELFLLQSQPKMYFPNYYVPGPFNWTRIVFLDVIAFIYSMYLLIQTILKGDKEKHKQYIYIFWTYLAAYSFLYIPNFLVYDIKVNPIWGMLWAPIFTVPFLYGAIRHGMFSVRIIAKQAFFYGLSVAVIGGLMTIFNYSNILISELIPGFPLWITALISSILAVTTGVVVWMRLRESDLLKYEFINTVTHKFRTPLTHIKWASENLEKEQLSSDGRDQIKYIAEANTKLVELTNVLTKASEAEAGSYEYHFKLIDLSVLVEKVTESLVSKYKTTNVKIEKQLEPNTIVHADESRLAFVIQTLVNNALYYSPKEATLKIKVFHSNKNIVCSINDNGIGIPKEELPLIFKKFYRGEGAKNIDTEGMGIGLFISKQIITRHRGDIFVESEGTGHGSTFSFQLLAA